MGGTLTEGAAATHILLPPGGRPLPRAAALEFEALRPVVARSATPYQPSPRTTTWRAGFALVYLCRLREAARAS
jgi:hypothetical protein